MKRILVYLSIAVSSLTISSCESSFELTPSNALDANKAVSSVDLLEVAVNGLYNRLVHRYGLDGDVALYGDAKGGDLYPANPAAGHLVPTVRYQTTKGSDISYGAYARFAILNARANNILGKNTIPDREKNSDRYKHLLGEVYAMRALAHFEQAILFAPIPASVDNLDGANTGIPLNTEVYPLEHKFIRATLRETYNQIISDLTTALPLLNKNVAENINSGHINYYGAATLLSRVYLYLGDYQNAYKYATEVINSGAYQLYTRDQYLTVWSSEGTSESIFEVRTTDKDNSGRNSLGNYTSKDGYPEAAAQKDFYNWTQTLTGDIRKELFKHEVAKNWSAYFTNKYPGQKGATSPLFVNNYKVFRLSELYLIASEALLKGATSTDGKTAVYYYNELRKNRIENYQPATNVTLDNILDERRIEFFCEGHRLFDLVRNRRDIVSENSPTANVAIRYTDNVLLIEMPQEELDVAGKVLTPYPSR